MSGKGEPGPAIGLSLCPSKRVMTGNEDALQFLTKMESLMMGSQSFSKSYGY
jgi:hypothetical protein